ncbi:MAG TPA: hypothetical protein VNB24_05425 [Acidimicrobiales bacterium]|nr:hypothetical protein [Acidimicrobiales bacterium]
MVLLVTIGLVIISALTLVVGFIQDSVGWIYASIGCSIAAAVILIISARTGRAAPVAAGAAPAPLDYADADETVISDAAFPIADYDELLVTEIIPLLSALDAPELEQVRAREQAGKARTSILRRIDSELDERQSAPATSTGTATQAVLAEEEPSLADALVTAGDDDGEGGLEFDDEPFPIEDYDDLRVGEVLPLLPQLYADELDLVAARERSGANRAAVLDRIAELLDGDEATMAVDVVDLGDDEDAEDDVFTAPAPRRAPKKAAAKKATAKKAAPAKKATAAKRVPAKKSASATVKKAPATKSAVAKTTGTKKVAPKKVAAKKTAAKKAAR